MRQNPVNFFLPRLMPGNPALAVLGKAQSAESPQAVAALEVQERRRPPFPLTSPMRPPSR